ETRYLAVLCDSAEPLTRGHLDGYRLHESALRPAVRTPAVPTPDYRVSPGTLRYDEKSGRDSTSPSSLELGQSISQRPSHRGELPCSDSSTAGRIFGPLGAHSGDATGERLGVSVP